MDSSSHDRSSPAVADEVGEAGGLVNAAEAVPFMLHVLLVLWISWLFLSVNLTGLFLLGFFIVYLFQVERRAREIERRGIAFAERKKINTRRTFDEGETSRWLNEGLKSMWPLGMEMFASKHFFGPMAPFFLDKYKPSYIVKEAKIDISSLHLGSTPPVFNCIRALEQPPEGDNVAYEAAMEFHSGDDMHAEMSVQTGVGKITFFISRLHIEGKVKISMKFLNGWPVVGRVRLCFASTPQVTMSYKPYNKNFFDVSQIPGVATSVDEMLHKAMEDAIVQPNMLEVDIEALASVLFPDSRPQQENKSILLVEILEASDLRVADMNGSSDPFVTIYFGRRKRKTKVIRQTLHPKWTDEKHEFSVENWDLPNLVTLHVQDWDRVRYRPPYNLGMWTVDLKKLYRDWKKREFGKRYEFFEGLEGVSTGRLRFAITVNHTYLSPTFEGPGTSDAGFETVTQEIKTDGVVYSPPRKVGATTEMKRSKSDTNLDKLRSKPAAETGAAVPKHKGKAKLSAGSRQLNPKGNNSNNPSMEASKEQIVSDERHDIIDMPYGPRGAFTIFHPGSLVEGRPPREEIANNQIAKPAAAGVLSKVDVRSGDAAVHATAVAVAAAAAAAAPSSWLRYPLRGRGRKRNTTGTSQENSLAETMSEQSERESIDMVSTDELTNLSLDLSDKYHGPVRMDRIDTPDDAAPDEPPDMYTPTSRPLSVSSGQTALPAPASPSQGVAEPDHTPVLHASSELPRLVHRNGSAFSGRPAVPTAWRTADDRGGPDDDGESEPEEGVIPHANSSSSPRLPKRQLTGKSTVPRIPKKWYTKIRSLAAKAGKKKTTRASMHGAAANGMAYSSEPKEPNAAEDGEADLDDPVEELEDDNGDPATTSSEYPPPLDAINQITTNGSTPGSRTERGASPASEPHEERNLMQETPLRRAAGSQSDRSNWASKMKKLIRSQSKSLRFDSGLPLSRPPPRRW